MMNTIYRYSIVLTIDGIPTSYACSVWDYTDRTNWKHWVTTILDLIREYIFVYQKV